MKIKRRIIHYKLSNLLLITGFVVSFICYVNCINLYHLKTTKEKENAKYQYVNQMTLFCSNQTDGRFSLEPVFEDLEGNLIAKELGMYRNAVKAEGITDVIVNQAEPLQYPVSEGELPEKDTDIIQPTIILGREHKKDTVFSENAYYYEIEGIPFRVCAFIGSDSSDLFDYNVILYYKGMPEEVKRKIDFGEALQILLGSNGADTYPVYEEMKRRADSMDSHILVTAQNEKHLVMGQSESVSINYYFVIMLFCIVNSIIVSEYWIKGRYREIAIRELLGYSDLKIFLLLLKDMIKNILCSMVAALMIQFILYISFNDYIKLYISQIIYYLGYCILFIFVLSLVMLIYPLFLLKEENILKQAISR
ncbi:MAG: hypothetical protein K2J90_01405 [Lachnospiraceae bacterium]|nr:hypothetical protein [Lachnospiraceae bacterium]